MIEVSQRLKELPPYLFLEIDKAKRKAREEGRDIIDFGVGDPDQPTPEHIIKKMQEAVLDPANHRYALDQGMPVLRQAICDWYAGRFGVRLDPDNEVLPLIGSKEGIAHLPLAFINRGEYSLVPDPCYPPYKGGTILAEGKVYPLPLKEDNAFLPDLKKIPLRVLRKARLIYINYPNNPTAAVAGLDFYQEVVRFCRKYKILAVSDAAYSELSFDGFSPPSFLQLDGAKEVGIEFHSLSKTFNMTGWRIGWVCGQSSAVSALAKVKSNIDSGIFSAIQVAGVAALKGDMGFLDKMRSLYKQRRDLLVEGLKGLGWQLNSPKATFYLWIKVPLKMDSISFSRMLLEKADIVVTPGVGFGKYGEGYIRMALTVNEGRIQEAITRLKKIT